MCQVPTLKINGDSPSPAWSQLTDNTPGRSDSDPVCGHHGVPQRPPPRGRSATQLPEEESRGEDDLGGDRLRYPAHTGEGGEEGGETLVLLTEPGSDEAPQC